MKNKKIKLISTLLLISIIVPITLFSKPKKAEALIPVADVGPHAWARTLFLGTTTGSTVVNTGISIKNVALEVIRQEIMLVEKRLLQKVTQATVSWINTGFHGAPLFIENPGSFFKDIGKTEIKSLVSSIGYDSLHQPFGKDFALNIINSYGNKFESNSAYTLSNVINDPVLLQNYRNNFNVGGWNGFLINTQYPQNNYVGYQLIAADELARRLQGIAQSPAQKVQATLQQGLGFLSPQTCPSNPAYNNGKNEWQRPDFSPPVEDYIHSPFYNIQAPPGVDPQVQEANNRKAWQDDYDIKKQEALNTWATTNTCPGGLVTTTPGSVVGSQIVNALGSNLRETELGAALGNSFGAILDALLNKFFDKVSGGLTGAINGKTNASQPDITPGTCSIGGTELPYSKTKDDCVSLGGTFTVAGAASTTPEITGTCTTIGGGNSVTTQANCDAIEGTWSITPPVSAPTGICTTANGSTNETQTNCTAAGGSWAPGSVSDTSGSGSGPECTAKNGDPMPDITTQSDCSASGGIWGTPDSGSNSGTNNNSGPVLGTCTLVLPTTTINPVGVSQSDCSTAATNSNAISWSWAP